MHLLCILCLSKGIKLWGGVFRKKKDFLEKYNYMHFERQNAFQNA